MNRKVLLGLTLPVLFYLSLFFIQPVDEYNRQAVQFKRPKKVPPSIWLLRQSYINNTQNLLKKLLQIRTLCNSSSEEASKAHSQFCNSLEFRFSKRVPQAIIIGVSRSGTSLMTHLLNEHPFVSIPLLELNFFNNEKWRNAGDLLDQYIRLMPDSLPNQLTMEKTPGYIFFPYVPERVRPLMGDNIRFIVQFRDPVERVLSVGSHSLTDINEVYNGNIKEANMLDQSKYVFYRIGDGPIRLNEINSIFASKYVESLSHWLRFYSLDHFHFVSFEDFRRKPLQVMKGIEQFLGIPHWFDETSFYIDEKGRVCYKKTELLESEGLVFLLKKLKSDDLHVNSSFSCISGTGIYPHYIEEEYKKLLEDYFRPYNQRLYNLTGINFGW